MLLPSSSERRCCRSNQRVWNNKAGSDAGDKGHLHPGGLQNHHSDTGAPRASTAPAPLCQGPGEFPKLEGAPRGHASLDRAQPTLPVRCWLRGTQEARLGGQPYWKWRGSFLALAFGDTGSHRDQVDLLQKP